jgi:hypothetical protein
VLDLRLADGHHDARGAAIGIFAPLVLLEKAQRLSHGPVETLRGDLDRVLDALRILACDPVKPGAMARFREA